MNPAERRTNGVQVKIQTVCERVTYTADNLLNTYNQHDVKIQTGNITFHKPGSVKG